MAIVVDITHEGKIPPKAVTDTPQIIENCNMFNIEALEDSLKYMTLKNYWSLYDLQKRKIRMERYDIKFHEFLQDFRLPTETQNTMYSRRYVYYIPSQFIEYQNRKKFKLSEFYNTPVDFTTISKNPAIYARNFLIFINGRFISTAELLPLEDKTGIIIDVASSNDSHGIPLEKYKEYSETDATVTVILVPNFTFARFITNRYVLTNNQYIIPFSKFNGGDTIKPNELLLINTTGKGTTSLRRPTKKYKNNYINKRFIFEESILSEFSDTNISDSDDMISSYDFLSINFSGIFKVFEVDGAGYFKINGKMPCPREDMLIFTLLKNGDIVFDHDMVVDMYYPNIYHVSGGMCSDECTYLVYCFYDETMITENEEYQNQIELYEQYVNLLDQYTSGNVPDVLKDWYPSKYSYGKEDYDNTFMHFHMPNTTLYKIFKMYDTIKNDPWALKTYLNFLLCPTEKYYIDMSKLNLQARIRTDTTEEPIVEGTNFVFSEPHYVFAMNRRFLKKNRYDFRIWIDGLFIRDELYHMEIGLDYYYIYIPTKLITSDSVMEIERFKLFDFYTEYSFSSLEDKLVLNFDDELVTAYAHDIYVVNTNTNEYIDRNEFIMKVYSKALEKEVEINPDSFSLIGPSVTISIKNDSLIGTPLRIGIHKGAGMNTGDMYDKDSYYLGDCMFVETANHGNYKSSDYRVFNNGRLLLPVQWQTEWSTTYGGVDSCQTNWALKKGDQITVDHVPCTFRTVYYQADVPEDGLIDLDGKVNLPINLKWYDIYLNGRRLHSGNIQIVSPTKFYLKNVNSRRHLIIFDRNRDYDVFFLSPHYEQDIYDIDRNDTIMDKLIKTGLADIIAAEKDPIDNTEPDIGGSGVFGPGTLDAIVYFLNYLTYSYVNCNYKLLSAEVKKKFSFFINSQGVLGINANVHPSGVLYKVINCNKGVENMDKSFTTESVETGLRELNDRFAITPLHSSNYEYALKGEFLCDPETGGTGIRHNDGTITMIDEVNRKKEHIDSFEQKLILANIGRYSIFDAQFDDNSKVKLYFRGTNLLDNEILIERNNGENIGKVAFSIDTTVLQKSGDDQFLRWSNHDPSITITYYTEKDHTNENTYTQVASRLGDRYIEVDTPVLVISSIVLNLPDNAIESDVDNPDVEDGESIDITKGITLTDGNYENPELGESPESDTTEDTEDCVCPQDERSEESTDTSQNDTVETDTQDEEDTDYTDDELYNPIGSTDSSELTDPMRCIVHSILIGLKEGGLVL